MSEDEGTLFRETVLCTAWGNGSVPAAIVWGVLVEGEPTS